MEAVAKRLRDFLFSDIGRAEQHLLASLFSIGLFGFLLLYVGITQPDLRDHMAFSGKMMAGEIRVAHPVFFFLLQLFSFFSGNPSMLLFAAFLCFAFAQYGKLIQSIRLCETIREKPVSRLLFLLLLGCQLAIGFILLQPGYIRASLSPNFFHNGTLLLSLAPSLFLLNQSLLFLKDGNRSRIFRMMAAGILIVLIKPSFLFCWIPVLPVYVFFSEGAGKKLWGILQVGLLLIFCLLAQSLFLKNSNLDFKLVFDPFRYFGNAKSHVLVFTAAAFFPLSTLLPGWTAWKKGTGLLLGMMTLQGLVLSFCFFDRIKNIISPNMTWQSSIMHYLLLLFGSIILVDLLEKRKFASALIPLLAYLAQLASGLQYLRISTLIKSFFI
jgi:hypothetical protein